MNPAPPDMIVVGAPNLVAQNPMCEGGRHNMSPLQITLQEKLCVRANRWLAHVVDT